MCTYCLLKLNFSISTACVLNEIIHGSSSLNSLTKEKKKKKDVGFFSNSDAHHRTTAPQFEPPQ